MKVIIAGSRDINDYDLVCRAVAASGFTITEVISGHCEGVDLLGERWSLEFLKKKATEFPYERKLGTHGGPYRNEKMAQEAEALIAIPGHGKTDGTRDMIRRSNAHGLKVYIHEWEG